CSMPVAASLCAMLVRRGRQTQNHPLAATFLHTRAKRGPHLLVAPPMRQEMSPHATWHLQFKPGSDVPMLNAMLHTIIEEGLVDRQYVEANVEGFEALKKKVEGYSPEKMAPMCGVPAERLRGVARGFPPSRRFIPF